MPVRLLPAASGGSRASLQVLAGVILQDGQRQSFRRPRPESAAAGFPLRPLTLRQPPSSFGNAILSGLGVCDALAEGSYQVLMSSRRTVIVFAIPFASFTHS
jgi:hypothetical protein